MEEYLRVARRRLVRGHTRSTETQQLSGVISKKVKAMVTNGNSVVVVDQVSGSGLSYFIIELKLLESQPFGEKRNYVSDTEKKSFRGIW